MTTVTDLSATFLARINAAGAGCWLVIGDSRTGMNAYTQLDCRNAVNLGIGGITTKGWLDQWTDLAPKMLGGCPVPGGAIINLGANDAFQAPGSLEYIGLDNNLAWLIGSVKAQLGHVIVCAPMGFEAGVSTTVPDTFGPHAPYLSAVGVRVRKQVSILNLPLLDLEVAFAAPAGGGLTRPCCTLDGIHPNYQCNIDTQALQAASMHKYYPG